MMSLVDRRRELEAQREVRSWPRQQVKQGQSLDVEAGVSEGCLPPLGLLNRAEGGRHLLRWAQLKMWTPET